MSEGGTERISADINGHSIVLEAFVFVCENDGCGLEEQSYAGIRHNAANTDCPAENGAVEKLHPDTDRDDDREIRTDGGTSSSGTGRKEVLRGAVEVWGEDLQIQIAIEELSELTTELARRQRGRESYSATVEEIADVQLCLDQLKLMYNPEQVEMAEQDKLERLKRRVERDRDE